MVYTAPYGTFRFNRDDPESGMFDQLRDAMRGFSDLLGADERRRVASTMKDALVHAKLAMQDQRAAIAVTEQRLAAERKELETIVRRSGLAAQIGDQETVAIADRFAAQHLERVTILESKLMVQQQELSLNERELEEMSGQLRRAMSGLPPVDPASTPERAAMREVNEALGVDDVGSFDTGSSRTAGADVPPRRSRADREAEADERLAELKRRLGK